MCQESEDQTMDDHKNSAKLKRNIGISNVYRAKSVYGVIVLHKTIKLSVAMVSRWESHLLHVARVVYVGLDRTNLGAAMT